MDSKNSTITKEGVANLKPRPGYEYFSISHDKDKAIQAYKAKYGEMPKETFYIGYLLLGPVEGGE